MKELPILFKGPMVVATMDGRKTQTRRIVNRVSGFTFGMITEFGPSTTKGYDFNFRNKRMLWNDVSRAWMLEHSPWQVGQIRYVRETFAEKAGLVAYRADGQCGAWMGDGDGGRLLCHHGWTIDAPHEKDGERFGLARFGGKWKPSIHMPSKLSRIKIEILKVGLEQVQLIDDAGALAEGVVSDDAYGPDEDLCACQDCSGARVHGAAYPPDYGVTEVDCQTCDTPRKRFQILWDSINDNPPKRPYGWDTNPFVWVIGFKRLP